jgi:hypothetical protein
MFFEIGPVLLIVPFEFHRTTVFYSIYNVKSKAAWNRRFFK